MSDVSVARRRRLVLVRTVYVPMVVALCVMVPKAWQGEFNVDTGRYAAVALQAWEEAFDRGDAGALWTLMGKGGEGGVPYWNKPPLGFWVHGLFLYVGGESLLMARLPSVLAACVCVGLTAAVGRRLAGARVGLVAGCVLATTVGFVGLARAVSLDVWLAMWVMGMVWAAVGGMRREAVAWKTGALMGVFLGAALLTKPFVGLVGFLALVAWVLLERRRIWDVALIEERDGAAARWWWCAIGVALVVGLVIGGGWHVSMWRMHGQAFVDQYLGREVGERASGQMGRLNEGARQLWYYPGVLVETYWPWVVTVVLGLVAYARKVYSQRTRRLVRLCVVWTVVWGIALVVFPDKRPRYLAVVYPVWALLSAAWMVECGWEWVKVAVRGLAHRWRVVGGVGVLGAVVVSVLPVRVHSERGEHWDELFAWIEAHPNDVLWEGAFDLGRGARIYLWSRGKNELALTRLLADGGGGGGGGWPVPTRDNAGVVIARPPVGAYLIYHEEDGWEPGGNEEVVWRSEKLLITRLGKGEWEPKDE